MWSRVIIGKCSITESFPDSVMGVFQQHQLLNFMSAFLFVEFVEEV